MMMTTTTMTTMIMMMMMMVMMTLLSVTLLLGWNLTSASRYIRAATLYFIRTSEASIPSRSMMHIAFPYFHKIDKCLPYFGKILKFPYFCSI